jgi:hypothetical protein
MRLNGPAIRQGEEVRFACDPPPEGGVSCELVSEMPNSLLAGKIQGISPIRASAEPRTQRKRARNQFLTGQFPTHPNREFFCGLQGIKSGDQGKFRSDQGIPLSSTIWAFVPADNPIVPDRSRTLPRRRTGTPPDARSRRSRPRARLCPSPGVPQIARRARRRERSGRSGLHDGGVSRVTRARVHRAHRRGGPRVRIPVPSCAESAANLTFGVHCRAYFQQQLTQNRKARTGSRRCAAACRARDRHHHW